MYIDYSQSRLEDQLNGLINDPVTAAEILAAAGIIEQPVLQGVPELLKAVQEEIPLVTEEVYQDEDFTYLLTKVPRAQTKKRSTPGLIPAAKFFEGVNGVIAAKSKHSQKHQNHLTNGFRESFEEIDIFAASNGIHNSRKENTDLPMGLDIIQKIRKFLNFGGNSVGNDSVDNRKRRAEGDWSDKVSPQIKYRKVENQFPKIIQRPLEEEIEYVPNSINIRKQQNIKVSNKLYERSPLVMSQQRNNCVQSKQDAKQRRNSLFTEPQTIRKNVTNIPYADIEYSDDESEIVGTIHFNGVGNNGSNANKIYQVSSGLSFHGPAEKAKPAKFCNIPINHVGQLFGKIGLSSSASVRKPTSMPPPLIEARTGGILASTLIPELKSIRRHNGQASSSSISGTSAEGFTYNQQLNKGSDNSIRQSRIPTYSGSFSSRSKRLVPQKVPLTRSILVQEQQTKDRDQYSELLHMMMPKLYGIDETSIKSHNTLVNKKRKSLLVSGRKSINQQENRPPPKLTTTISLTDDDDGVDDVILSSENIANIATILNVDDENDVREFINLADDEEEHIISYNFNRRDVEQQDDLPYVEPVNTLREKFELAPVFKADWLSDFNARWSQKGQERKEAIDQTKKEVEECAAKRKQAERDLYERMKSCTIFDPELVAIDEFPSDIESEIEEESEPGVIEFTPEQQKKIQYAISGSRNDVLITKFNMSITRRDIETLLGLSWLNDEVINFYMNLLIERSEKRNKDDGLPMVYSMNTFFVPRLMEGGHSAVRRWTRKVNIFERDVIPVPVHVGGVHWCMAIIHLKNKTIKYYDSMGTPNPKVLEALEKYLKDESLDKLKKPFDTSNFIIESVSDVPRQFNGSDCGVFSCMFAEYITRNKSITFTQEHMPYFRHKMILEIAQGELLL